STFSLLGPWLVHCSKQGHKRGIPPPAMHLYLKKSADLQHPSHTSRCSRRPKHSKQGSARHAAPFFCTYKEDPKPRPPSPLRGRYNCFAETANRMSQRRLRFEPP